MREACSSLLNCVCKKRKKTMLSANVLCLKKKKKRTYCLPNAADYKLRVASKTERSRGGGVTMLHITEDTPPDMLAGAMDLTVHLPSGRSIKMSVERSTPMMDLLVQITTNNQLQLSNYTLQALGMAPSAQHSDKILPFKPNTPIGALDTQHVRVLPKGRSLPAPKYVAPGHQPFESTFRLKVHLPRNQLYVTRVSRNVLLEDIMKKVCEEKNLDPMKYEFKHPGNLDEVLDPKLTLSDYQITEIYVVHKGTTNLNQAFSAADIMSLRKEEERKHMHNKTGGGVFNLIFKRGKSSMGSGSVSSDNRSISPTQSDDSRSVTPPGVQPPPIITPPKKDPPPERPKPPQRKRRPAPKPPQIQSEGVKEVDAEKTPSVLSNDDLSTETATQSEGKKAISENGLTICHSRNSSDSSGYHEASILSEHCANTSLPRGRPKSALVQPLQGGSNLTSMAAHSRSTTSLIAGRKKKAAPLPPSVVVTPASSVLSAPSTEKPSPLVASQPNSTPNEEESLTSNFTTQTPNDNLLPISPHSDTRNKFEEKSLDSTDSGIAQDSHSDREREVQDLPIDSPPKVFVPREQDSVPPTEEQSIGIDSVVNKEPSFNETVTSAKVQSSKDKQNNALSDDTTDKLVIATEIVAPVEPSLPTQVLSDIKVAPQPPKRQFADAKNSKLGKICTNQQNESELIDIDWHYQLPSPPKAFRDVSPLDPSAYEATSVGDLKDSVVTSPELFEKLKSLEDSHSENGTLKSEVTSIASEEPLNTLSLEHLEKRKSLVYNRELATSLKMTDSIGIKAETKASLGDTFSNSLSTFESTYDNMTNTSIVQEVSNKRSKSYAVSNTLPNFKITTYDVPKQKIKVFEDETIRSNSTTSNLKKSFGGSMQNISHSAKQNGDYVTKETSHEYIFYRPKPMNVPPNVSRSGSFSDNRLPMKPVSRSKSQLTLTKYKDVKSGPVRDESLSRSTSSFDISGLQSLEVMKLIQNKLDTPTGPVENLQPKEQPRRQITPQSILPESEIEDKEVVPKESNEDRLVSTRPIKKYHYRGPPAVELATWSERPKVPVAVKEDADYKLGNHFNNISSKLIVNTTNNNISSNNSIEIKGAPKSYGEYKESDAKFGGANEEITQKSGNVVIKIGGNQNSFTRNFDNPKLLGPTGYRKPFSNVNGNANGYTNKPRPHSIALDSNFDISRVPVVRSVEFKKPYKDIQGNNTSVTHIFSGNDSLYSYNNNINEPEQYRSAENIKNLEKGESETHRKIFRVGSYKPIENHAPPVVRGFRAQTNSDVSHRLSWNPSNYGTLPLKTKQEKEYSTNQHVPFSQLNLRRTESSRIINNDGINQTRIEDYEKTNSYTSLPSAFINRKVEVAPPPPPPQMPKLILRKTPPKEVRIHATVDPRDMLMESIRNFGGKKGLKLAKA
ncbi:cordon-bleu protein-like 1 isoform X4 [Cylas formicarius]|uniref:cordon-bleu protein-like 1 isoform X4 n=1 Tax=Cylas formicarius TaxID=197179 RepID=UPI002958DEE6|nr:cordon-bleu protein-like 1 isoform X4 [Cylas formicarius]